MEGSGTATGAARRKPLKLFSTSAKSEPPGKDDRPNASLPQSPPRPGKRGREQMKAIQQPHVDRKRLGLLRGRAARSSSEPKIASVPDFSRMSSGRRAAMRTPMRNRDERPGKTNTDETLFCSFRAAHEKSPFLGALFGVSTRET